MSQPSLDDNAVTFAGTLKAFLSWWSRELLAILPEFLKTDADRLGQFLMIAFESSEAVILHRNKKAWTELGRMSLEDGGDSDRAQQFLASITREVTRSDTPVILRLSAKHGLQKILEFPPATEKNLRKILENQIDRVTPYQADQVYFDYRLLDRNAARDKLRVELIASPREFVDAALSRLERWGTRADFLDLGGSDEPAVHMIDLTGRWNGGEQARTRSWLTGALALANIVLVVVALGMPITEKARTETELRQHVATLKLKADAAARLRAKVNRAQAESTYLEDRKRASTRAIVVLNEVTRVLPDGTWLDHIKLKNGVVQLYGYSPRAATLIAITERSPMFQNAQFRAPVTQHGPHGTEQFHLSADLASTDLASKATK